MVRGLVLLVFALVLVATLSGCEDVGTAGAPATIEASPPTTDPTPATAGASNQERQNLLQAMEDGFSALAAGILLTGPPDIDDLVDQAQLIVRGTVTKVDSPRTPEGDVANPYIVFYVDPTEVLKGSPRFGTPLPFAIPGRGEDTPDYARAPFEGPVEVGDEVLVFSYHGDSDLPTGSGGRGADFLWNDTYGLFLPATGNYVCARMQCANTTLDEVRRMVGPDKNTSTTLGPGYMPFEGKTIRFEERLRAKELPETLPFLVSTGFDISWVAEAIAPVATVTAVKGYRLANGDRVFLFDAVPPTGDYSQAEQGLLESLRTATTDMFEVSKDDVWVFWNGGFGYVVVSDDFVRELGFLAQMAQTGAPLPADPEDHGDR